MIEENYLRDALENFQNYKKLAEKSFEQISDEEFFRTLNDESNSIATIAKHIAGNLRSRWTEFLTADGEKPDRNRDSEFVAFENDTRKSLLEFWNAGWQAALTTIESLQPADLEKTVKIRGENHTVVEAVNRSIAHTAYHVGQIVFLAKFLRDTDWQTLSIPRNRSADYNRFLNEQPSDASEKQLVSKHETFLRQSEK
ncbi:MAG TPA: DinB family protein [Pyrinomonadaceae bacterium]|nr:DinB family protein [Pyrinomonadaceae bacterium]